jgi:hypothetical protein
MNMMSLLCCPPRVRLTGERRGSQVVKSRIDDELDVPVLVDVPFDDATAPPPSP